MDITTATPAEIDTKLADIYGRAQQAQQKVISATSGLHYALNERRVRYGRRETWPTTTEEALAAVRARVADPEYREVPWGGSPAKSLTAYETAVTALDAVRAEADPLNAEFARRGGWTRFFSVKQHNGHIHSSMNCSTCNRGVYATEFGWNADLSGMSMAEAITHFDRRAYVLCTVCYPDAPVEWTVHTERTDRCKGTDRPPVEGTRKKQGMRFYGQCPECSDRPYINVNGGLRAHKPKAPASA
ncbi:hypothetical protein OOJ91_12555 [Micromonospora lupini]|uniref:hypothetical protein n=1 Tax=Micromonospora lupini TaxID=285679 RepID=UPI00225067DC|nr:hypothetical protein [Micromonospora lupini]MCX5066711.1 hypothetical protein [Micromonospora lupini]